jgi:hypothetical protein
VLDVGIVATYSFAFDLTSQKCWILDFLANLSSSMPHARRPRRGKTPPVIPISSISHCFILSSMDMYIKLLFCSNADTSFAITPAE